MSPYETNGLIANMGVEPISATNKVEIIKEYTSRADRRHRDKNVCFGRLFPSNNEYGSRTHTR